MNFNINNLLAPLLDKRVYIGILLLLVALVLVGIYSVKQAGEINKRVNNIFTQELIPLESIEDIKASMYRIRDRVGRHLAEPKRQAIHEKKMDEQLQRMQRNLNKYKESRLDVAEKELLQEFKQAWWVYIEIIKKQVVPLSKEMKTEKSEDVLFGDALFQFRNARKAINALSDYQLSRAEHRQQNAHSSYILILQLILGVVVASAILFVVIIIRYKQSKRGRKLSDEVLDNTSQGVMVTDNKLKIISVNQAFEKITGFEVGEVLGRSPSILSSGKQEKEFYIEMWQQIKNNGRWEGEIWNKRKDGRIYPEWLSIVAIKNNSGSVERYSGTFIDLSALKKAEEKVNKIAYYDGLTGLGNQYLLEKRLGECLAASKVAHEQVGVLLIDLDHFKEINNSLGRYFGNILLKEISNIIRSTVADDCLITRHDSDRFVVVVPVGHSSYKKINNQLSAIATRINIVLSVPIDCEGNEVNASCSIGIASYPQDATEHDTLLKNASIALHHAKAINRGHYCFYQTSLGEQANHRYQLGLGISKAIERNELYLVYQPQIDRQGNVICAEVLLRWESKEFGNVPPDVFIPLAEERGDILDIGRWVFKTTLTQMKIWKEIGLYDSGVFERLAINVSPHQILSENSYSEFNKYCELMDIPAHEIELEITETSVMNYSDRIITHLKRLNDYGFSISLDDFGTGYSSLGRLHNFPISILKIDRSFTQKILSDESQAAIVQYIINMAHTLGLKVVVEGVEQSAEVRMLLGFGCDIFQGYYFSKPLSSDNFTSYIIDRTSQELFNQLSSYGVDGE